jgi:hypothetical protein
MLMHDSELSHFKLQTHTHTPVMPPLLHGLVIAHPGQAKNVKAAPVNSPQE